jgi:cell division septation protein DedD
MASSNEGEANSFAERLKTVAIPAYVVRADLGSHGIWYRVRIGRFATPEEAQRFAAEARARARAVGVTLKDLQVTGYDKP